MLCSNKNKKPRVIIVYGAPGSGKGTQAHRVAENHRFKQIDTGQLIRDIFNNPANINDSVIKTERDNYNAGRLCAPEWVAEIIKNEIKYAREAGESIVFSGSPRTLYEAKKIIPLLEKLYGQENIRVLELVIRPETSIYRNSHRRICKDCGQSLYYKPENEKLEKCPACNGELIVRKDDQPKIIKNRLKEYRERTAPIYEFLEKRGIKVIEIDGEPELEEVEKEITSLIK